LLLLLPCAFAHAQSVPQYVDCIAGVTPCNATSQVGTGTEGDPAWQAFGKINADLATVWDWALSCSVPLVCSSSGVLSQGTALSFNAGTLPSGSSQTLYVDSTNHLSAPPTGSFGSIAANSVLGNATNSAAVATALTALPAVDTSAAKVTASGTTTARTQAAVAADWDRPEQYANVAANLVTANVSSTASSCTVTVGSNAFATGDAGKIAVIPTLGTAGATYVGTLASVTAGSTSTLVFNSPCPQSTVTNQSLFVGWGYDATAAINAAWATGGVTLGAPFYLTTGALNGAPSTQRSYFDCNGNTVILAGSVATWVATPSVFYGTEGSYIHNCIFRGMGLATTVLNAQAWQWDFGNDFFNDAITTNVLCNSHCQDTHWHDIRVYNGVEGGLTASAVNCFHISSATDTQWTRIIGSGCSGIGFWGDTGTGGLLANTLHLFRTGTTNPTFQFDSGGNKLEGLYADNVQSGGTLPGIAINANNNNLTGCMVKAQTSWVDQIGVNLATGTLGNVVEGCTFQNWTTGGAASAIVQAGTSGSPANTVCNNGAVASYNTCAGAGETITPISWYQTSLGAGIVDYLVPGNGGASSSIIYSIVPMSGHFVTMTVREATAPATTANTATLYTGAIGSATASALTCTIAVSANSCSVTANVSLTAGQAWSLLFTNNSSGSSGGITVSLEYENP
jgi:hypothetical protein